MLLDGIKTLDDFSVNGKHILVRLDINVPVDRKSLRIEGDRKIRAATRTISELLSKGAAVVILAHQGRPGDYDFIPLQQHFETLKNMVKRIEYTEDILGADASERIKKLGEGEALLLGNVRKIEYEQKSAAASIHASSEMVKLLAPHFDYFVNDAFAAVHRPHCSMVGFTPVLPSAIGRLMEEELRHISPLVDNPKHPVSYLFGGKKTGGFTDVLDAVVSNPNVDTIMLAGFLGVAFLVAEGAISDAALEEEILHEAGSDFPAKAATLLRSRKILLPEDLAYDMEGRRESFVSEWPQGARPLDIGERTIEQFCGQIASSSTVFISGPPGMYEREEFASGTKRILETAARRGIYAVAGGGHTSSAAERFGVADKLSYVSTGGGALEAIISGKRLQVLSDLRESAIKFKDRYS
ncbi:MAG: phosphoglycerate kinase [Methanomassiliicoccales archaeon]